MYLMTLLPISLSFIQQSPYMMRPRKIEDDCHRAVVVQHGTHGRYGTLLWDHAYTLMGGIPPCDSQPSGPKQNSQHFVHNIVKYNSLIENCCIFIQINIFNCSKFLIEIVVSWLRFRRFFLNNKLPLVQMLTSEQATSHDINPYLTGFVTPYGVIDKESIKRLSYISSKSFLQIPVVFRKYAIFREPGLVL